VTIGRSGWPFEPTEPPRLFSSFSISPISHLEPLKLCDGLLRIGTKGAWKDG
jgi:hypothetical protein